MARPQRNNIDYFPHSIIHGKNMFYMRSKYKNDGYTVWFMLLEKLGKAEYHFLDLDEDVQRMYLSAEMMVNEDTLINIINDLVKLKEFDRELWEEESILYNEKFVESIEDAYKKRNNNCIDKNSLVERLTSKGRLKPSKGNPKPQKGILKGDDNTQSKVKDSKEDNRIYRKFVHLEISKEENQKLIDSGYSQKEVDYIYDSIENYKKNTSYKSLYLTAKKWLNKEYGDRKPDDEIPPHLKDMVY